MSDMQGDEDELEVRRLRKMAPPNSRGARAQVPRHSPERPRPRPHRPPPRHRPFPPTLGGAAWTSVPAVEPPTAEPVAGPERGSDRGRSFLIDGHCHVGQGAGFDLGPGRPPPFARYLLRAREAGISRTVIFSAFHADYSVANREVARLAQTHPDRLAWFACVHPEADRGRVGAILDEGLRLGCVGVKAHRSDGRITREVCQEAQRRSLPVLYDPRGEIAIVDAFARDFPEVAFIVPHFGSFDEDARAQRAFLRVLPRRPNLYADTSGVRLFDLLDEAVRRAGPKKLIFGSDSPWLHPGVELAKVRALHLPPQREQLVLGGNLVRLCGQRLMRWQVSALRA